MEIKMNQIYLPTGNEQVSIPTLFTDGRIENINFISMQYRGLVEIDGSETTHKALLKPVMKIDGKDVENTLTWQRESYWIPSFHTKEKDLVWQGEICAPVGERGFYYLLQVKNEGRQIASVEMGVEGGWGRTLHTINESKVMKGSPTVYESGWNGSLMFEFMGEAPLFAFAPMTDEPLDAVSCKVQDQGEGIEYSLLKFLELQPGQEASVCFYWGVGLEEVGAATSAKEMQRKGWQKVKQDTMLWLNDRIRTTGDARLDEVMNVNLFFNYFFATGKSLDTEEDVWVTSRSPRYYVSAAYWDRDSLLWSFPAILITDQKRARQMLDYVFAVQGRNFGVHSRYIDGVVLEPGFELDELCAPVIALDMYLAKTGDWSYLRREFVQESLQDIMEKLAAHRHPEWELYDTFLQPTDDPIVYPYLTYNNVLVWKVFRIMSDWAAREGRSEAANHYARLADQVREAIQTHMVVVHNGERLYAWSVDLQGNYNVYDEPPGSLQLLPYYGFCSSDDPIYRKTVEAIRSPEYHYAFAGCEFEELGCDHADHPWVLSIANSCLSGRQEQAKDLVVRASMDGGIACESIDEHTGEPRTGEHFATCAGFLAYAIYYAYGQKDGMKPHES